MTAPAKIIVTGAAQGIGRAVALRLAARGVHIAVWDTKSEGVEDTARLCREQGATARVSIVDVGDANQGEAAVATFEREWAGRTGS
jgi:NAD(P)-dependent dehydrogenase (short-subunit alcohol dehydrogenase family)